MRTRQLRHQFVDHIPAELEDVTIYVSIPFATIVHRCCCGCGNEVVAPLGPKDWRMIFDGETISVTPSIGNWSYPCQSHYWIDHNRVHWGARRPRAKDSDQRDAAVLSRIGQGLRECVKRLPVPWKSH